MTFSADVDGNNLCEYGKLYFMQIFQIFLVFRMNVNLRLPRDRTRNIDVPEGPKCCFEGYSDEYGSEKVYGTDGKLRGWLE